MVTIGVSVSVLRTPAIMPRLTALFSGSINLKEQIKESDSLRVPPIVTEQINDHDLIHHS